MEIDMAALKRLQNRIQHCPEQVNNNALYAGSPMFFYCQLCGHECDRLPESYNCVPKKHCQECLELKGANPRITETTLKEMAMNLPIEGVGPPSGPMDMP
jgi:hypothetical protein